MKRFLCLASVLYLYLICTGCGDTYRPVIIPNPPVFPNPAAAHTVVTINDNAPPPGQPEVALGTAMSIDVSGDTIASVFHVGLAPVHAVQQSSNKVLVVNHSVTGAAADSITALNFNGTAIASATTITLPAESAPSFVAVAPNQTTAYVTLPTLNQVASVNLSSNTAGLTIPVGNNPVALAVTPDNSKLYVANQLDSTISGFNSNIQIPSERKGSPTATSSAPIWLVPRSDNQVVYVLESDGTFAELAITGTEGPDTLTEHPSSYSVPGATTMLYDGNKNRLYIPGGPIMRIIDVSQTPAQVLETVTIPNVPDLNNQTGVPASAMAVAALPDGTRAYVASMPNAAQSSAASISAVQGDGTDATFTYTWTGGHDLAPGIAVAVSGLISPNDAFNGTYIITSVTGSSCNLPTQTCTFQVTSNIQAAAASATGVAASLGDNLFPQVTVVTVLSGATKTIGMPGFPDATNPNNNPYYSAACVAPVSPAPYRATFRLMMAAGGDSSRAYMSSCDGGTIDVIYTSTDTYALDLPVPIGTRPNPLGLPNLAQSPVFLIAGP